MEKFVEAIARSCQSGEDALTHYRETGNIGPFLRYLKQEHHESPTEFGTYVTFSIDGVSRACTHQLVRHRIASHMERSFRHVGPPKFNPTSPESYQIPLSLIKIGDPRLIVEYLQGQINSGTLYQKLYDAGVRKEDARLVEPEGLLTHINTQQNARALITTFFLQRTCDQAQWELGKAAQAMLFSMKMVTDYLFQSVGPPCIGDDCYTLKQKGDKTKRRKRIECKSKKRELIRKLDRKVSILKPNFNKDVDVDEDVTYDLTDLLGFSANPQLERIVSEMMEQEISLSIPVYVRILKCS